ncbi:MAG TPA: glycosyltransferase family A protein [Mycobacteriales bacterium]|nr:glycosyltransferase family A protein [Mycobacteriales bacterium]
MAEAERAAARAELHSLIPAVSAWVASVPAPATSLTVIIATRDRAHVLPRAVSSVLAQDHARLELIVVDDGSTDETATWLAGINDRRLSTLRTEGIGLAGARNRGLAAARGEIVTYLDDDNVMLPGWMRAVAWAFDRFPDAVLVYGARVIEDRDHLAGNAGPSGTVTSALPRIHFEPYSRDYLREGNFIDANVMGHRREHPEARFDERLGYASDWDLALRLTAGRDAVPIPVLACAYTTREPTRMSLDWALADRDMSTARNLNGINPLSPHDVDGHCT